MTDSYRISENTPAKSRGTLRPVLWLLLIVSLAANAVTSTMGFPLVLSAAFGLVVLASATALIMHHRRHR